MDPDKVLDSELSSGLNEDGKHSAWSSSLLSTTKGIQSLSPTAISSCVSNSNCSTRSCTLNIQVWRLKTTDTHGVSRAAENQGKPGSRNNVLIFSCFPSLKSHVPRPNSTRKATENLSRQVLLSSFRFIAITMSPSHISFSQLSITTPASLGLCLFMSVKLVQ